MFKPASQSAALPIAYVLLRLIIVLNWLIGAAILLLLVAMPNERWIMSALDLTPSPEASRIVMGLRAIAVVGLVTIPINHAILKRLVAMVVTVRIGDPFVAANARRLQVIAWALLALQLLGLVIAGDRQGDRDQGASDRHRGRFLGQRLDRGAADVRAGAGVRRRHGHARRTRRDGVTWRSASSSTSCSTRGG